MAKKKKKVKCDFEKNIFIKKCRIGLAKYMILTMKIYKKNIYAFNGVVYLYDELKEDYEQKGYNDDSEEFLTVTKKHLIFSNQNLKYRLKLLFVSLVSQLDCLSGDCIFFF